MKNKILAIVVLIAALATTQRASAQVGELRHNLAIGINGGATYNTVSFAGHRVQQLGLLGKTGGLTLRYISEKYFAMICGLQVELNYAERGWDKKFTLENGDKDPSRGYTHNLNYFELPFLAHLAFGKDYGAQVFINLGPQIGYLLSESDSSFGLTDEELQASEEYGKLVENKFDYGIVGGLGLEIHTRRAGSFLIEGRYYFGLADFYNSAKKDYFSRSANTTISAKITYLFDIKK
jgi:hypothetical protein